MPTVEVLVAANAEPSDPRGTCVDASVAVGEVIPHEETGEHFAAGRALAHFPAPIKAMTASDIACAFASSG